MSQPISASVSLVIEPLLSLLYFNFKSRIFFSAKNVNFFLAPDPFGQYGVWEVRFLIHSGTSCLTKADFFI